MKFSASAEIDVYPVGVMDALQPVIRRCWSRDQWRETRRRLRQQVHYIGRQVRARDWRAVKNSFNGYLAEPRDWPEGLRRCGSAWSRRRAEGDLRRRAARA